MHSAQNYKEDSENVIVRYIARQIGKLDYLNKRFILLISHSNMIRALSWKKWEHLSLSVDNTTRQIAGSTC